MKEATGELNMTVVTVVAIAAVGAFFYAFVWPNIKGTITSSTKCAMAICDANGTCYYTDENGNETQINCKAYNKQGGTGGTAAPTR